MDVENLLLIEILITAQRSNILQPVTLSLLVTLVSFGIESTFIFFILSQNQVYYVWVRYPVTANQLPL